MSITTKSLTGRKDKSTGKEAAWGVVAANLKAENYPNLDSAEVVKNGEKSRAAKVPLFPSNVSYREFETFEDVESDGGSRFKSAVVMWANERSKTKAEAKAKASIRDMKVYDGSTVTFDGTTVDIYAEETSGATGRATVKADSQAALAKLDEFDGDVEAKLAFLMAKMQEFANR